MAVTLEGTLWIELVDVYIWIESLKLPDFPEEAALRLRFSIDADALLVEFEDADAVKIDAASFWTWVIEHQLPRGIAHFETVFGVPRQEGPDLVVSFAAASGSDPREWGEPPACLAEWFKSTPTAKTVATSRPQGE